MLIGEDVAFCNPSVRTVPFILSVAVMESAEAIVAVTEQSKLNCMLTLLYSLSYDRIRIINYLTHTLSVNGGRDKRSAVEA